MNEESGVLIAYGITAAGKTYTIEGDSENPGLLPQALIKVCDAVKDNPKTSLCLSIMEIHNESVFDLLEPNKRVTRGQKRDLGLKVGTIWQMAACLSHSLR